MLFALFQCDLIILECELRIGRIVAVIKGAAKRLGDRGREASELFRLEVAEVGIYDINHCAAYTGQAVEFTTVSVVRLHTNSGDGGNIQHHSYHELFGALPEQPPKTLATKSAHQWTETEALAQSMKQRLEGRGLRLRLEIASPFAL